MGPPAPSYVFEPVAGLARAMPGGRHLPVRRLLSAAGAVWAMIVLGAVIGRVTGPEPAIWPVNALLVAIALRSSVAYRPAYLCAGLLGSVAASLTLGNPTLAGIGYALCNLLEAAVATVLLAWPRGQVKSGALDARLASGARNANTVLVMGVAALAPLLSVTLATAIAVGNDGGHFGALWWPAYGREALDLIILLPFALVVEWSEIAALFVPSALASTILTLGALLLVDAYVFCQESRPILFLVLPMLTWAAFRIGVAGAALAMLLTAAMAVFAISLGHGPLMLAQRASFEQRVILLQMFLAVAACTTVFVAAVLRERKALAQQLLARFTALSESHVDLAKRNAQIEELIGLEAGITAALPSRRAVIDFILSFAQTQTGAVGAVMERVAGDELVYEVATGPFSAAVGLRIKRNASLSGSCSLTNEVLRCDDASTDVRVDTAACERLKIRSMIVVPIAHDGFVSAVLKVASDRRNGFSEYDVLNLQLVARHVASAMRAAGEYERSERAATEAQATIDHLAEGVVVFDADLLVLRYNVAATRILQMNLQELPRWINVGTLVDLDERELAPEDRPVRRAYNSGQAQRDVIVGNGVLGVNRRWVSLSITPIRFEGGRPERYVLSARDVTQLQQSEIDHRDYVSQLRSLHLIASQVTSNRREQIEAALALCREELGLDWAYMGVLDAATAELVVESSVGVSNVDGPQALGARLSLQKTFIGPVIESKDVFAISDLTAALANHPHISVRGAWGAYIAVPIRVSGATYGAIGFTGRRARPNGFTESERDFVRITGDLIGSAIERGLQRERLDALAYFDALTGLPNRVVFQDRLVQTLLAAKRYEERFAVLYLDLDGFKAINDGYGHGAGDEVLKIVGKRLEKLMRDSDTVARIGGDEFLILAPKLSKAGDAGDLAWRAVQALRSPMDVNGIAQQITASVGVSLYPEDGMDAETIVKRADAALYRAKTAGKNAVAFATEPSPALV